MRRSKGVKVIVALLLIVCASAAHANFGYNTRVEGNPISVQVTPSSASLEGSAKDYKIVLLNKGYLLVATKESADVTLFVEVGFEKAVKRGDPATIAPGIVAQVVKSENEAGEVFLFTWSMRVGDKTLSISQSSRINVIPSLFREAVTSLAVTK
jgi:hypothetical protein